MTVKTSVIVPVYNPGPYIEDCIGSLLRQSLPDDEYEVIFVDDGSTDDSPTRLDELAAQHQHIKVIHQENSGWSGKPRNVGIEESCGEFVMFVDNDDWLGDEALERMHAYGVRHSADVVIGKMAGRGRPVPTELFRVNRPRANVMNAPLIDSLTPHKMFRRSFLDRQGLRFPEERRRLEDHVFVTEAFLTASSVAVLSDYLCYYHVKRDDASNAGFQRFDPVGYYRNLRDALDVVEKYTEPGPLRDKLQRRWFRNEMIHRMRSSYLLGMPEDYRHEMFREIHKVAVERFGPGVDAGLMPTQQITGALIKADRYPDVETFARWEKSIAARAELTSLGWEGGVLTAGFTGELHADRQPMVFHRTDPAEGGPKDRLSLPFGQDTLDVLTVLGADTSARTGSAKADLLVRERSTAAEFYQPVEFTRDTVSAEGDSTFRLVLRGTASIDPETAAGGAPLARGIWDVLIRVHLCGWTKEVRLGSVRSEAAKRGRCAALTGSPPRVVLPYWTDPHGNLSLDVCRSTNRFAYDLEESAGADTRVREGRLEAFLPLCTTGTADVPLHLCEATGEKRKVCVTAKLTRDDERGGTTMSASLPVDKLVPGIWILEPTLGDTDTPRSRLPLVLNASTDGELSLRRPHEGVARKPVPAPRRARPSLLRRVAGKVRQLTLSR